MSDVVTGVHAVSGVLACSGIADSSAGWLHMLEVLLPGAVGGAIALLGVRLANQNSAAQLRTQLDEAAREATRAREFNVRRDAYLDAAEAIAAGHGAVGEMLDVTVSDLISAKPPRQRWANWQR